MSTTRSAASDEPLELAAGFEPVDAHQWRDAAIATLRGADFDRKLVSRTLDDIELQPLYTANGGGDAGTMPGVAPFTRGARADGSVDGGWDIRQRHLLVHGAVGAVNDAVLRDLERGVTSIEIDCTAVDLTADTAAVIDGVMVDLAPVALRHRDAGLVSAEALLARFEAADAPPSTISADLGVDPIGALARLGGVPGGTDAVVADAARLAARVAHGWPSVRTMRVDGEPYADAGAGDADEIAVVAATGLAYLRALEQAGLDLDTAAQQLLLTITVGTDQFAAIAKLRALRRVWSHLTDACGIDPAAAAPVVQAVTARFGLTERDPWVNMLRTTVGCFAAAVGGADIITVAPFDSVIGRSDELGLRAARNTQLLLLEEANLHRVIDPAGGSWYVESFTESLTQRAWQRFQAIESAGGMIEALRGGLVQGWLDDTWERRRGHVATRRTPITGVNEFPDIDEAPVRRPAVPTPPAVMADAECEPLAVRRLASPFEALRDAAGDAAVEPAIFLANLGPIAEHTARAGFAKNFFEAGGIRALSTDGFEDPAALAEAFTSSGASAAVLCSSDTRYDELAVAMAEALAGAGATWIALAGNPGEHRDRYQAAGVQEFIHIGSDVLAQLEALLLHLGVAK